MTREARNPTGGGATSSRRGWGHCKLSRRGRVRRAIRGLARPVADNGLQLGFVGVQADPVRSGVVNGARGWSNPAAMRSLEIKRTGRAVSSLTEVPPAPASGGARLAAKAPRVLLVICLALAMVNVGVLLAGLRGILSLLYVNADAASAPVIASLAAEASGPGSRVTLGNYPNYEIEWLMRATASVPAHRVIWEVAPIAMTFAAFAVLVTVSWRLFGRFAALVTAAIVFSVTPFERFVFWTPDFHGMLVVYGCGLMGLLLWLFGRPGEPSRRLLITMALALGPLLGAELASDFLGFPALLVPFVFAAFVGGWRLPNHLRVVGFAIATAVMALVWTVAFIALMISMNWRWSQKSLAFAPGIFAHNLGIFLRAFAAIGGGDFLDRPTPAVVAVGVLSLAALATVLVWLTRSGLRMLRRPRPPVQREGPAAVFVSFWGATLVAVCATFLLSNAPVDESSGRYLASAFIACASIVSIVVSRQRGAVLLTCLSAVGLFAGLCLHTTMSGPRRPGSADGALDPRIATAIERFVLAHDAPDGYASYHDAAPLAWRWGLRARAFPAVNCLSYRPPRRAAVCPYYVNSVSSEYGHHSGRTFLIVDNSGPETLVAERAFGVVKATGRFRGVVVYVYDHDIGARAGKDRSRYNFGG